MSNDGVDHYLLTWDRCGRSSGAGPRGSKQMTVDVAPGLGADGLAEAIFRIAKKYLASRMFEVDVMDDGTFSLEYGRFGGGRWQLLANVQDSEVGASAR